MNTADNVKSVNEQVAQLIHRAEDQLVYCNYSYADSLLQQAQNLLQQTNDVGLVLFHNDVAARLALAQTNYEKAFRLSLESLHLLQEPLPLSRMSFLAAQCLYHMKGHDDEVIRYCDDAIRYADNFDSQDAFKTGPMRLKAHVAYEKGNDDQTFEYINESIQFSENANMPTEKAFALSFRSRVFERQGKMNLALEDLYLAERYMKDNHDYGLFCRIAVQRIGLMFQMGLDNEAKEAMIAVSKDYERK